MSAMQIKCPHCQQVLSVPGPPAAASQFKCPRCGKPFAIAAPPQKPAQLSPGSLPPSAAKPPAKAAPPRSAPAKAPAKSVPSKPPARPVPPRSPAVSKTPRKAGLQNQPPSAAKSPPTIKRPVKSSRGKGLLGVATVLFLLLLGAGGVLAWFAYPYFKTLSSPTQVADASTGKKEEATTAPSRPAESEEKPAAKKEGRTEKPSPPAEDPEPEPAVETPPARPRGTAGKDEAEPFPVTVPEEKAYEYNLANLTGPGAYKLVSSPSWLTVSPQGMLKVRAPLGYRGGHKVVFTVGQGAEVETFRFSVQITPPMPVRAVPGARRPLPEPARPGGSFRRLPTEALTTAIAASEDGKLLFAAHQEASKVSVWDLRTGKLLHTFETPEPRALLCRGGKLFVSSNTQPVLRVFTDESGWKLADELKVGAPVFHLTAPQGAAFANQIIANGLRKEGPTQYLVEVTKDQLRPIAAGTVSSVDAGGRYLLMDRIATDYRETISGGRIDLGEYGPGPLFPTPYARFWVGRDGVWSGMPPQPVAQEKDMVAVADLKREMAYFVGDKLIKARLLQPGFPTVGSQPITFPASYAGSAEDSFFSDQAQQRYFQHVAVTTGGKLMIFLLAGNSREVYWARLPAFADKPLAPSSEPGKETPAVNSAVSGTQATIRLPNEGGKRTFALLAGPEGLTLDADGTIHWKPGKEQIGSHEIKARVTVGSKTSIERFPVEVLDSDLVAAAGGDPSKAGAFTTIELGQSQHRLSWSLDRKHLLLLQGRQLDLLSPNGRRVERSIQFDRYCELLMERPEYYVGMSPLEVRLLDKQTGKTLKTISLKKYRRLHDIAIHPTRKLTYVALENTVAAINKNKADWQRVVQVDEDSGAITELDEVYGRFLAVDPRGRTLYTGFKDIYEEGVTFHINPGGHLVTFPEYGNIDILFRFKIDGNSYDLEEKLSDAGGNGNGLALAPDGEQIAYLSNGGYPSLSRNVVALRSGDFKKGAVTFATNGKASCMSLVYHPVLSLVACSRPEGAVFFDRRSGAESPNRLKLTAEGLGKAKVEDLLFSPDGKAMIFVLSEPGRPWYLRSVPLNLSSEEALAKPAAADSTDSKPPAVPETPESKAPATPKTPEEAEAAITRLGGDVKRDKFTDGKPIVGVKWVSKKVSDKDLVLLRPLTKLTDLSLVALKITDAGLVHLQHLADLESLDLGGNDGITDAGLAHLKKLPKLKNLRLLGTRVRDKGVKDLKKARPDMEVVY